MVHKYFKPNSLTWWSAVTPLAAGVFMAFTPVHDMVDLTASVKSMFGGASPAVLINAGLVGIGLRGAVS